MRWYSGHMDEFVVSVIKEILTILAVDYTAVRTEEVAGQKIFTIDSAVDGALLTGSRGETLQALDMLIRRILEKRSMASASQGTHPEQALFLIDVNGYRVQKIKDLQQKSLTMAERARSLKYDVELEPMSSYERLIVHSVLAGQPNIKTESQGDGLSRRIVIRYKVA